MPKWSLFRKVKKNNIAVGIDFGTTMSRITYVQPDQQIFLPPEIPSVPSIVSAYPDPQMKSRIVWNVGEKALLIRNRSKIKLDIGVMQPIYKNDGLELRPEILAARIIYELRKEAGKFNNSLKDVTDVTITVPAEWSILNRNATVFAAKIAGFQNVNLIEEPVAAYLAIEQFMKENVRKARRVLVFDCGGGTLDVTIIVNENGRLPFAAGRATDKSVAGENIDEELARGIVGEFRWSTLDPLNHQRDLSRRVKKLKEALNPINITDDPLAEAMQNEITYMGDIKEQLRLTLDLHNQVVRRIVAQGRIHLDLALANCFIDGKRTSLRPEDIDCIVLVGGSSYLRPLQKMVKEYFGKTINQNQIILFRPEDLVAIGAALWQSYIQNEEKRFQPTLSMKTYLLAKEMKNGLLKDKEYLLGKPGDVLPIEVPKGLSGQFVDIPKGVRELNWKVFQSFAYSDKDGAVPVEWINYNGKIGGLETVRLEYMIDKNGVITKWKPSFILSQEKDITPPFKPYYNWDEEDVGDDADAIARKYSVRH